VVAIGVSTGGPEALTKLIPQLPADLAVPVVLVQHMPPVFTKSLADSLAKKSPLRIVEASDGETIQRGSVYIAPGGRHMVVRRAEGAGNAVVVGLNDGPPENSCRPAVDVLFRSVAAVYGDKGILTVILTGMGSDGCAGVRTCKRASCFCITQSEATCVVYGMPRAVDEAGLSDLSLPLDKISAEIVTRVNR
jgi:two-component system chemotaxis response regulator CheB